MISCSGGAVVARGSHKPEVVGSNPSPATSFVSCVPILPKLNGRHPLQRTAGRLFCGEGRASRQPSPALARSVGDDFGRAGYGVADAAVASIRSALRGGGLPLSGCSVAREAEPRGRVFRNTCARPRLNSFRHRALAPIALF